MPTVGKIELKADKDVDAGAEVSLSDLFSYSERSKEFPIDADVTRDKTKLKIDVAKLGSLNITADSTTKKGQKTSLSMLTKYTDINKKVKASEAIKKGDALTVNVKTV